MMGDHRFSFKAEFEMHGVKDTLNLGCNWSGGYDAIDSRITDWIEDVARCAFAKFDDEVAAYQREQNKAQIELNERAEFERLRAKFEPNVDREMEPMEAPTLGDHWTT